MSRENDEAFRAIWADLVRMIDDGRLHGDVYGAEIESVFAEWLLKHDGFFTTEKRAFLDSKFEEIFDDYVFDGSHQSEPIKSLVRNDYQMTLRKPIADHPSLFLMEYWEEFYEYMQELEMIHDTALQDVVGDASDELQDKCIIKLKEIIREVAN